MLTSQLEIFSRWLEYVISRVRGLSNEYLPMYISMYIAACFQVKDTYIPR